MRDVPSYINPVGATSSRFLDRVPTPKPEQWRTWINAAVTYADRLNLQGRDRDDFLNMAGGFDGDPT